MRDNVMFALVIMIVTIQALIYIFSPPSNNIFWWIPLPIIAFQLFGFFAQSFMVLSSRKVDINGLIIYMSGALLCFSGCLLGFAQLYCNSGLVESSGKVSHDPTSCLYFSVITITTVGYGDFIPTTASRLYAAIEALMGTLFLAIFISTTVHAASNFLGGPVKRGE